MSVLKTTPGASLPFPKMMKQWARVILYLPEERDGILNAIPTTPQTGWSHVSVRSTQPRHTTSEEVGILRSESPFPLAAFPLKNPLTHDATTESCRPLSCCNVLTTTLLDVKFPPSVTNSNEPNNTPHAHKLSNPPARFV